MRQKTPSTATREINPDSAVKARPMLCPRVKQERLVLLLANVFSSGVQIVPFSLDMIMVRVQTSMAESGKYNWRRCARIELSQRLGKGRKSADGL